MRIPRRTELRLALAILLVAVLPLVTSIFVARDLVERATSLFFNAEVGQELEHSVDVYGALAQAIREAMWAKCDALATHQPLRDAAVLGDSTAIDRELQKLFIRYPDTARLQVVASDGGSLGIVLRDNPVDPVGEIALEVRRPLTNSLSGPELVAVFAAPRERLGDVARAAEFVHDYHQIERQRFDIERLYLYVFIALVGITIAVSTVIGILLARQVTLRINGLALATRSVGAGDLSVRVPEEGVDEISDLARAFNRMLEEVEESRARIEFLRRIGAWQEMARRLAHEIKNPLTPIQLAVEECHRRYRGDDPAFRKLLDTTLEIVGEEVSTLRRLVTEFSNFARMPRAELIGVDLGEFLREQKTRLSLGDDLEDLEVRGMLSEVSLSWSIPTAPTKVALDPMLFHRVLANVLSNSAQAIRGANKGGAITVTLRDEIDGMLALDIDDDGPGIPLDMRARIFDPYVTTKSEGTGLGLAIVQKIVVEHGGTIDATESPLGGARIEIRLPRLGSAASDAALKAA
jgi:nitrogen fixation/metabolism regulation signal transduction histidine kinase